MLGQKDEAMQLFKDVKSPADAMKVIKENPAFVENLEGVVVDSVEDLIKVRKTPLLRHCIVKMIILPRQAQDKHRKKLRRGGFFAGNYDPGDCWRDRRAEVSHLVKKRVFLRHSYIQIHHFTKTGSGQT